MRAIYIFLDLASYQILTSKGKVSHLEAKLKAEAEYEIYRKRQDAEYISDFDRILAETKRLEGTNSATAGEPRKGPRKP